MTAASGMSAASGRATARPLSGRTAVLSPYEMAVMLLYFPAFHRLAETLPYKKDLDNVHGHRDRDYPKAIVLLLGVMSRVCRSLPKAEAMFRPPHQWDGIRSHWRLARQLGIVPENESEELSTRPIKAGQWRYCVRRISEDPDAFAAFEQSFLDTAVELALSFGYFMKGSLTSPDRTSCLFADGTELRSQCRSYIEERVDEETGETRIVAIDPGRSNSVRAWLVKNGDRWHAIDPSTGEVLRKLPVDVDALASGKYGATQSAHNVVPLSVRSKEPNSRVTLTIGIDEKENAEAATILRLVERVCATSLRGRIQCLITDKIIRGMHMVQLFKRFGITSVTKVAAAPEQAKGESGVQVHSGSSGKKVKSLPLPVATHTATNGKKCKHMLCLVDGWVTEVDFDATGRTLIEISRPVMLQNKRAYRNSTENPYYFNIGYRVSCMHGDFDVWLCPHKETDDDGRRMAENFRVFPEGSEVYKSLYGISRNTSEGGNGHQKDTYPHKRSQASGRIPVLLDVYLYFVADNAKNWYFQVGWETVDPRLHLREQSPTASDRLDGETDVGAVAS